MQLQKISRENWKIKKESCFEYWLQLVIFLLRNSRCIPKYQKRFFILEYITLKIKLNFYKFTYILKKNLTKNTN